MLTRQFHPRELAGSQVQACLEKLDSSREGLRDDERENRHVRFGDNRLSEKKETPLIARFLKEFTSPFVFLLLGVAALSLYTREWSDAIIITIVLLVNATIGTFQSARASRALQALKKDVTYEALCLIEGVQRVCDTRTLVPGDVIEVSAGDRIPADGRWINATDLRIDESSLTGESVAASKTSRCINLKHNAVAADVRNAGYAGTTVVAGTGTLLITTIGTETEMGRIAQHLSEKRPEPPLVTRVRTLSHQVLIAITVIAIILFIASLASGSPIVSSIPLILALIVAIVPEGLPVVLTIVLASGVRVMSKRNALVKELQAVESLGGVDTIFTDKTGTLTRNELRFHNAYLNDGTAIVLSHGEKDRLRVTGDKGEAMRFASIMAAIADPAAGLEKRLRSIDPIDRALFDLSRAYKLPIPLRHDVRPFDGITRTRAVTTTIHDQRISILAGSPEQIFASCGDGKKFTEEEDRLQTMASQGLRVIAFAERKGDELSAEITGWKFLGLIGLRDEARPEAKEAIHWCTTHGIDVTMVTGDHPETAYAIAKDVGLAHKKTEVAMGEDLMRLPDEELKKRLSSIRVIARAAPEAKMKLIRAAREEHKIIAMTGDGVNDAPALHAADVGVAMGGTGTDVAREAADMVLADDNFATIVDAIKEGRTVLGNVQKVVTYLFATNAMELVVIGIALAFQLPTPLLAAQILWLNLVTDSLPVLALATEPTHGGHTKPAHGKLLPKAAWIRIALLGGVMGMIGLGVYFYFYTMDVASQGVRFAAILLAMTSMQWWVAFSVRSSTKSIIKLNPLSNTALLGAIGIIFLVTILALSGGPLSVLLRVQPIPLELWFALIAIGALTIIPDEIWKFLRARKT